MQKTELIIRNARLRDNEQRVDIEISGGRIAEIGAPADRKATNEIDAAWQPCHAVLRQSAHASM